MSTDAFPGASFDHWLQNFPEASPEQEEWQDAQDERKEILEQAGIICETIPTDFDDGNEIDDAIDALLLAAMKLQHLRDEVWGIEDEFPAEYEPDWRD
jgi:hypothetical protein